MGESDLQTCSLMKQETHRLWQQDRCPRGQSLAGGLRGQELFILTPHLAVGGMNHPRPNSFSKV